MFEIFFIIPVSGTLPRHGRRILAGLPRLLFGLRPAQSIFSLARNIAFSSTLSPELTEQVSQASYTDNIHLVSHSVSEGAEKAEQVSGALKKMGFNLKTGWSVSGIPSEDPETSLLGLKYDQAEDILKVRPCFNLEKRVRGEKPKSGQMVVDKDVETKITEEIT